jgi:hypothetical protein
MEKMKSNPMCVAISVADSQNQGRTHKADAL